MPTRCLNIDQSHHASEAAGAAGTASVWSDVYPDPLPTTQYPLGLKFDQFLPWTLNQDGTEVAVHRLRKRFREAVRAEIGQTVATPAEVDEELRCLMAAMSG